VDVPYFVIDRTYGISGAQPAESILVALRTAWSAGHPVEMPVAGCRGWPMGGRPCVPSGG
jgi:predicted DsbA family dithiol-disulfide isomerase